MKEKRSKYLKLILPSKTHSELKAAAILSSRNLPKFAAEILTAWATDSRNARTLTPSDH